MAVGRCAPIASAQVSAPTQRKEKARLLLARAVEAVKTGTDPIDKAFARLEIGQTYSGIGEKAKAEESLDEAARLIQPVRVIGEDLSTNILLLPLARTYAAIDRKDKAEAILAKMLAEPQKVLARQNSDEDQARATDYYAQLLTAIAPIYVELGERDRALSLLSQSYQRLEELKQDFYKDQGLGAVAATYAAIGQRQRAVEVANMITNPSADKAWDKIAAAYADAGEVEKALEISRKIQIGFEVPHSFLVIARKYAEAGQKEKAATLLREMTHPPIRKGTDEPRIPFAEIAVLWAEMGDYVEALRIAKRIAFNVYNIDPLTRLAPIFAKAGRNDDVILLLTEASKATVISKGAYYEAHDIREVAQAYADVGRREDALRLLSRAVNIIPAQKTGTDNLFLEEIALTYATMGLDDRALEVAEMIADSPSRAHAFAALAGSWLGVKPDDYRTPLEIR